MCYSTNGSFSALMNIDIFNEEIAVNSTKWPLFRIVVPKFPNINIYTRAAKTTTDLGSVMLATVANKLWGWRVEVIAENNYSGPKDKDGLPNHELLQKENPADVVGFAADFRAQLSAFGN